MWYYNNHMKQSLQHGNSKIAIIAVVAVLLIAIIVGVFVYRGQASGDAESNLTPTSFPTSEPEPTEEEVDKAAYEILVLNGTEVAGEAGKLKTALEDLDYVVSGTANADKDDYSTTIIQAKASVSSGYVDQLKEDLEGIFDEVRTEELDEDDDNDVKIIIGGVESDTTPIPEDEDSEGDADATSTPSPTQSTTPTP